MYNQIFKRLQLNGTSSVYTKGVVVDFLRKIRGRVVELVHQIEHCLVRVAVLQQVPDSLRLGLGQRIIDYIATNQHYRFLEQQLGEQGENAVGSCVGALPLVVFHKGAELSQ